MTQTQERRKLVDGLEAKYLAIDFFKPNYSWLENKAILSDFLKAWEKLVEHYKWYDDSIVDADLIHIYVTLEEQLDEIISKDNVDVRIRGRAKSLRLSMKFFMHEILDETTNNLHNLDS